MADMISEDDVISQTLKGLDSTRNSSPQNLDDELTNQFKAIDSQRQNTGPDNGVGYVSDKVRRVGQGASEGSISAVQAGVNIAERSAAEMGKGFSEKPSPMAERRMFEQAMMRGDMSYTPEGGREDYASRAREVNREVFTPFTEASQKLQGVNRELSAIKSEQREVYGANPKYDKDFMALVASGIGSSVPAVITSMATGGASLPTYGVAALQLYQENFDSAIQAGQTIETAHKSGLMAMPLTAFEKFGDLRIGKQLKESLERAYSNVVKKEWKDFTKDSSKKLLNSAMGEAVTEGAQTAGKQVIENEILGYKDQLKEERLKEIKLAMSVGSVAGGVMASPGVAIDAVGNRNTQLSREPISPSPVPAQSNLGRGIPASEETIRLVEQTASAINAQTQQGTNERQALQRQIEGQRQIGNETQRPEVQGQEVLTPGEPVPATEPVGTVQPSPTTEPVVKESLTTETPVQVERPSVEFEGPTGNRVTMSFDGYQDLSALGRPSSPQFTVTGEAPSDLTQKGSYLGEGLDKKGYKPVTPVPTLEQWQASKSTPQASLTGEPSVLGSTETLSTATGPTEITELLRTSGMAENTVRVATEFLNQPVMQRPEFAGLQVALKNKLELGGQSARGVVDEFNNLVELSRSDANPETIVHESFHLLHNMLDPKDQALVERWRAEMIRQRYGPDAPVSLLSGRMTSQEAAELGIPIADYPLINPSEFLAEIGSNQFTSESNARANSPEGRSLIQKIKEWLRSLLETIKRITGFSPSREQFVRDILAGKRVTTPESGIKYEKRASLVVTAKDSANAEKLMQNKAQEVAEGRDQTGQVTEVLKALEKNGASSISPGAQDLLGYSDYVGIVASGERLTGQPNQSYGQLKAQMPSHQVKWVARLASTQIGLFEEKIAQLKRDFETELKRVTSKTFLKDLARESKAKQELDISEINLKIMNAMFDTAIKKAQKAINYERQSEREIDAVKGQILEVEDAKASSAAMVQLLNDMVNVLSSTPEGVQLLTDPNFASRTDIQKVYKDIKNSSGSPLHSPSLLKWGAYLLQKSKALRENFVASYLNTQAPIRTAMNTYEQLLTTGLQTDPVRAIKELRRDHGDLKTDAVKAKFAYQKIHKRIQDGLRKFELLSEALDVGEKAMSDPDFKAAKVEIHTDSSWEGKQKPVEVYQDDSVMLPSGTVLDIGPNYFVGPKQEFQEKRDALEAGIKELKLWLNDPKNKNDDNYNIHARTLNTLDDYFTGLGVSQPNDPIGVVSITFGILRNQADMIGGRISIGIQKALRKYERITQASALWMRESEIEFVKTRIAAMKSHGMSWTNIPFLKKGSIEKSNARWYDTVGNILFYSHNTQTPFKVGDVLPTGEKVTKEDMDHIRSMSHVADKGFKVVERESDPSDKPYVKESMGGYVSYRGPLKGTENMTPRTFSEMEALAKDVSEAWKLYNESVQKGDQVAAQKALDTIGKAIAESWNVVGTSLAWDRNADFSKATVFDGQGGGIQVITDDLKNLKSADEFFNLLSSYTGYSVQESREILLKEWAEKISNWFTAAQDKDSPDTNRADEQKNPFTRSRNQAIAPYVFYENGFKSVESIRAFAAGMQSRALDEVAAAFDVALKDLNRQESEYLLKVKNQSATGDINPSKTVRDEQRIQRAKRSNIDNFDNYERLKVRKAAAVKAISSLKGRELQDIDAVVGRTISLVTGMLISMKATARNMTMGPVYIGRANNRIIRAGFWSYPVALYYSFVAQVPLLASGTWSLAKTIPKIVQGGSVAIYKLVKGNISSPGQFVYEALAPMMKELGTDLYNRIKFIKEMQDSGVIDRILPVEEEISNRLMGSMLSKGLIRNEEMGPVQKAFAAPLSILELLVQAPTQQINPKFGDMALNSGIYLMMRSKLGAIRFLDRRLQDVAIAIQNGTRAWDRTNPENPINILTHKEIYPAGWRDLRLFSGESDMDSLMDFFKHAGLDFNKYAGRFINDFISGNKHPLFTNDQASNMISTGINFENRGTAANNPDFAKRVTFWSKFLSVFQGWPTRMVSEFTRMMSVPLSAGKTIKSMADLRKARVAQFGFVMMLVFAFLVAGALTGVLSNEEHRAMNEMVYNQISAYRQPWEREGAKSQAMGWAVEGLNNIPIIGGLISMAINDVPVRASTEPSFVMVEKVKQFGKYFGGVLQTGDFRYKLPEFVMNFMPDTRILLSRIEGFEGRNELNNTASILRRYGPQDSLKSVRGGSSSESTELTPYADRMANAAMAGDDGELEKIYGEAVEVARSLGRDNPERVVREMFRSRNPYDRVFKSKLTDAQRQKILESASPEERALVEQAEQKFSRASERINSSASFTSEQASNNRSYRSSGTRVGGSYQSLGSTGSNAGSGASFLGSPSRTRSTRLGSRRGRRRSSGLRSRRTRVRTGRSRIRNARRRGNFSLRA